MEDFEGSLLAALPRGIKGRADASSAAEWAGPEALGREWEYRRDSLFLGYRRRRIVGWKDDRHVLTVAGSRAGKGIALMVPNFLLYEGSVLAIDPKGELARITSRARRELGQTCYVLDPFGTNGRYASNCFNPLAELDLASPSLVDDAALIADALVIPNEREPHWTDNARRLLKTLILFVLSLKDPARNNLGTVRDLLMLHSPALAAEAKRTGEHIEETLLQQMIQVQEFAGAISREAQAFLALRQTSEREFGAILSTTRTQTEFLDSMPLRAILKHSDFRLADLKRSFATVFLCLPASRMASHAKWLRVMITLALLAFERETRHTGAPVLLLLEEFPILGHMQAIESAAGQIAGFGVKLWTVLQDLGQIKRLYKSSWETFVGNAGVLTFFGNTDLTTLRYISDKLGRIDMDIVRTSGASSTAIYGGVKPITEEKREGPLLHPHEIEQVFARETNRLLVLAAGRQPLILERARYYEHGSSFTGMFDL